MAIEDQERGALFEKVFSKVISGKVQPQSGGGWRAKLDIKSSKFLVSCKSTKHKSFSVHKDHFAELKRHLTGVGGEGDGDRMGVFAVEMDGEVYIVQRCDDWLELITSTEAEPLKPNKTQQKRINAGTPAIMRKMMESEDG